MYGDLDRPPLRADALARALGPEGWDVQVVERATSTQALARGGPPGRVVVAEEQTEGRGRLDRTWVSPARAGLTFSAVVRPEPIDGWVPLLAGLAVANAVREQCDLEAELKWPNDVLLDGKKVCGLLAEVSGSDVVIGIGLNVTTTAEELPHDQATSLRMAGATVTDRDTLLRAVLRELSGVMRERPLPSYRGMCSTLGRQVRLELPDGSAVTGTAEDVDDVGRLVVDGAAYAAGDVVHLRG
ncbi:MAG: biotin--acetyl-CoA-carboxylase ligase [Frankiales bacterium]|nr:biotin--acetyl-CoA-carboxylase ligase [Frankiales bacterium]